MRVTAPKFGVLDRVFGNRFGIGSSMLSATSTQCRECDDSSGGDLVVVLVGVITGVVFASGSSGVGPQHLRNVGNASPVFWYSGQVRWDSSRVGRNVWGSSGV